MNTAELITELIAFLNETGQYYKFIEHAEAKGFTESEIDEAIDEAKDA